MGFFGTLSEVAADAAAAICKVGPGDIKMAWNRSTRGAERYAQQQMRGAEKRGTELFNNSLVKQMKAESGEIYDALKGVKGANFEDMDVSNAEKIIEHFKDNEAATNKLKSLKQGMIDKEAKNITPYSEAGPLEKGLTFFGDDEYGTTRIATAAAGYFGVMGAGRAISGGTMTRNSLGEKDIAGVPFF